MSQGPVHTDDPQKSQLVILVGLTVVQVEHSQPLVTPFVA